MSGGITDFSKSPFARLTPADMNAVRWTAGFWAERSESCRRTMIPHMWRLLDDPEISHSFENFKIAAGLVIGHHRGPKWHDGDFYKWLEAAVIANADGGDREAGELIDRIIEVIGKAQEPDGYLHTPVTIGKRNGNPRAVPFLDPEDFEMYNFGHLMTAACIHHRLTRSGSLLHIAVKAADYLCEVFSSPTPELARNAICPSNYMGIIELYRVTGDEQYRALGMKFLDMRDMVTGGSDQNQDRIPFRRQRTAVGHAVRANYLYAGAADIYAETGDASILEALTAIWDDMAGTKTYVTGATGALYDGASPDGSWEHDEIRTVHQAYGRQYQLPNITAYNETCATIGNLMWSWRMFSLSGEARYMDMVEVALYNGVLATIGLDGGSYFYVNTLEKRTGLPFDLRWSRAREPYISCFCCPPNTVRVIAESHCYAYSVSKEGIWVNLYGASRAGIALADGTAVTVRQTTGYPWEGNVAISVDPEAEREWSLFVRIPEWADGARVLVDGGETADPPRPGGYLEIRRRWKRGGCVEISLPMAVRLLEANPFVEEARDRIAVKRGPLVYCLESADLPEGTAVPEIRLSGMPVFRELPGFLIGDEPVTALETQAVRRPLGDWSGRLYREFRPDGEETVIIRLIPYYAWGNRGEGEMTVWLPHG